MNAILAAARADFRQRVRSFRFVVVLMATLLACAYMLPPFDAGILAQKGSLFFTRPTLMTYTAKRADLVASANALFKMVESGKVKIEINQTYPLSKVADAHRDLEARKTTGSTVLLPG